MAGSSKSDISQVFKSVDILTSVEDTSGFKAEKENRVK
jgi:hypothetical protein